MPARPSSARPSATNIFYSVSGANAHYGTPVNARAPGRLPGGSSAGSAAACGAGLCDFALGSDTGGSVRVPASFNGIYGLRPTHERIEHSGVADMAPSFDVPGWFAATPGVFRKVGAVLLDSRRVAAKIDRVVVLEDAFAQAEEPVADLLRTLLEFMSDDLPEMAHGRIAPDGFDPWREAFRIVQAYETWQTFGGFVTTHKPKIGPGVRERMQFASTVTRAQADAVPRASSTRRASTSGKSSCRARSWRCRPRPALRRRSKRPARNWRNSARGSCASPARRAFPACRK